MDDGYVLGGNRRVTERSERTMANGNFKNSGLHAHHSNIVQSVVHIYMCLYEVKWKGSYSGMRYNPISNYIMDMQEMLESMKCMIYLVALIYYRCQMVMLKVMEVVLNGNGDRADGGGRSEDGASLFERTWR